MLYKMVVTLYITKSWSMLALIRPLNTARYPSQSESDPSSLAFFGREWSLGLRGENKMAENLTQIKVNY